MQSTKKNTLQGKSFNFYILLSLISTLATILLSVLLTNKAHAASITIGGACTLNDAVSSVNSGSDQSGCTATGDAYGTNDTINLPSGVHSFDVSTSTPGDNPVDIVGTGMGQSIIDLGDSSPGIRFNNSSGSPISSSISDVTVRGVSDSVTYGVIQGFQTSLTVERVEIYSATDTDARSGVNINHTIAGLTSTVRDVYIHDINFVGGSAVEINTTDGVSSSGNLIENVTIENVEIPSNFIAIQLNGTGTGTLEGTVQNSTISNVDLNDNSSYISAVSNMSGATGTGTTNMLARNNTLVVGRDITTATGAIIAPITIAAGQTANATLTSQNNIIVSRYNGADEALGCSEIIVPSGGSPTSTLTSTGGNLTDDASNCDSFFTQTNDQTGITTLGSTLGPLQDNGGNVMTMALLTGSPAIDNGITNALTDDQRGTTRPQGSAFDTGAFEYVAASSPDEDSDDSSGSSSLADTGTSATLILIASISLIGLGGYSIRKLTA